jgi:choice-of-anchor B domain-containing protein
LTRIEFIRNFNYEIKRTVNKIFPRYLAIFSNRFDFHYCSNFYLMKLFQNTKLLLSLFIFINSFSTLFSQLNIDSLSHVNYQSLHGANLNDVWGYVDELGNEYAIVGTSKGTSIIDVTNPTNPTEVFWLPGTESIWRDPCVYGNYAYVTTEAEDGLQIIDLTPLPQSTNLTSTLYTGPANNTWQSAHTCFIDENGFAYIFGANRGNGGTIILDVQNNPMNPIEVGIFDNWYIHDGYVRNDTLYAAHIYDGFFSLVNVSNKANPILLGTKTTPNNFTHNIWPSTNGQFVYTTDEVTGAYIGVYDISNPTNIIEVDKTQHSPGTGVIPHNTHVKGDYLITSYYSDGVVIHDITYPTNTIKVAQFDTYPGQTADFNGCWGVYPFLPSGTILAADITEGLFILGPNYQKASYLNGVVTDQLTGLPINDVSVQIITNDQEEKTNSIGMYETGLFGVGQYSVTFQKVGYYPKTETVTLSQDQIAILNTQLIPIPPFNLNIQVYEAGGIIPISNTQIKFIHPLIEHSGITNALGQESLTLYYQDGDIYRVQVGKWGYKTICFDSAITENTGELIIELEKGYYDDFEFDFGWSVIANAETGNWERGIPNPTNNTVPNFDADLDCGKNAFITGNNTSFNPDIDDVDNGLTTLLSPQFYITGLTDPHLNYAISYHCFHGPGSADDTLNVFLLTGSEQILIDQLIPPNFTMSWETKSISLANLLPLNSSLQLMITISDYSPNINITEAGFDRFSITNYNNSSTADLSNEPLLLYPNPTNDHVVMKGLEQGNRIYLVDLNGSILKETIAESETIILDLSSLSAGIYVINHKGKNYKLIKN